MISSPNQRLHLFVREARFLKKVPSISLELRPGVHAIVARSEAQGDSFVRGVSGMLKPLRGRVLLGSEEPGNTPELRARIGSLLQSEPEFRDAAPVRAYLTRILALRIRVDGSEGPAPDPENMPYVTELLDRPLLSLTGRERRQVALSLALSVPRPLLLVLNDPLRDLDTDLGANLLGALGTFAEEGAIVACVVPTERAARQLSERVHHLEPFLDEEREALFLIRSERPRDVASSLAKSRNITATRIRPSGDLIVSAATEEAAAGDITQALASTQVEVFEVRRVSSVELSRGA